MTGPDRTRPVRMNRTQYVFVQVMQLIIYLFILVHRADSGLYPRDGNRGIECLHDNDSRFSLGLKIYRAVNLATRSTHPRNPLTYGGLDCDI